MAKTSASFTLMDYTDGISLVTGIDSNLPFTSLYDAEAEGTKLNPSWAGSTSLMLTPKVFKAGSSTSLLSSMTNIKWYRRTTGVTTWTAIAGDGTDGETVTSGTGVLTVKQDKLLGNNWQCEYKFTGTYTDPVLGIPLSVEMVATFSRVANGTSFVVARAYAPNGNTFRNGQNPATLTVKAELMRKTGNDTTDVSYKWEKSTNGTTWAATGNTTDTQTINAKDVDSFALFRCTITDNDASSDTHNQSFTTEGVAIYDVTDPYQAIIESSAGSFFKKDSTGSKTTTILVCKVYQNGEEIDSTGEELTYTWTKTNKDGTAVSFTPTAVAPDGTSIVETNKKAIKISSDSVDVKATFFCEVN